MNVEKKTIRSDIPGHHNLLSGNTTPQAEESRKLTVGRGIALTGEITSCDYLLVEGTVNAEHFIGRRLELATPGQFNGSAEVQDAVIAGRFDGTLVVKGRLTVKTTGRILGDVVYGTIEVEAGARLEGRIAGMPQHQAETGSAPEIAPALNNVETLFADRTAEAATEDTGGDARQTSPFRRAIGF
jgi:cytoskeletal protein CcmA (bactofilin family)